MKRRIEPEKWLQLNVRTPHDVRYFLGMLQAAWDKGMLEDYDAVERGAHHLMAEMRQMEVAAPCN